MININVLKENDYRLMISCDVKYITNDQALDLKEKIETLFEKKYFGMDINKIVNAVRVILSEFEEEILHICVANPISSYTVKFLNTQIHSYEYTERADINNNGELSAAILKVNFYNGQLNAYINNCNKNKTKEEIDYLTSRINEGLKVFYDLQNYKPCQFFSEAQKLLEAYLLFYKEEFDIKKEDINEKVRAMLYLLAENNILITSPEIDMDYAIFNGSKTTIYINSLLNKIKQNSEFLKVTATTSRFSESEESLIIELGNEINQFLNDVPHQERTNFMVKFCISQFMQKNKNQPMKNPEFIRLERKMRDKNNVKKDVEI